MDNTVVEITALENRRAGGKAEGLAFISKCGLPIPKTFVVLNPSSSNLNQELEKVILFFDEKPVAVRSSAADEDGSSASFAGQFETFLDVQGSEAIKKAVMDCVESAHNVRVEEYADHLKPGANLNMSVVIQEMVNAVAAGVIFTADPVTGRRDHAVINMTAGLGEELVSGHASGQQVVLSRSGTIISSSVPTEELMVNQDQLDDLLQGSRLVEQQSGFPQDLEWAIDHKGKLFWLQARPITTLDDVHFNELDSTFFKEEEPVITRGNIGEMMPGPVTPLTESVFAYGIDIGLQMFYASMGVEPWPKRGTRKYVYSFYNHLFFSLSRMYEMVRKVVGTSKETVEYSITGEILDTPWERPKPESFILMRIIRFIRYFRFVGRAPKVIKSLKKKVESFSLDTGDTMKGLYQQLDHGREVMADAWFDHYCTSGQSGALESICIQVLSGGQQVPDTEHYQQMARLLVNIDNIDGVNALESLDQLAGALQKEEGVTEHFTNAAPGQALAWLKSNESGESGRQYARFMEVNGHRCIREAEFFEKDWETDPQSLIKLLQVRMKSPVSERALSTENFQDNFNEILKGLNTIQRSVLKSQVPKLREAVARRENSKSLCIRLSSKLKKGYLALAAHLVERELLHQEDHVFFLSHQELGSLISSRDKALALKAHKRYEMFPQLKELSFQDHSFAYPEPIEHQQEVAAHDGEIQGLPVSTGRISGVARVVDSIEQAADLLPGEIMVVSYTDIGWTPYFSIIGGLVTEIGSSLSHGAVVAREYGIPAVVNVKNAKRLIRTGDSIELDGDRGVVIIDT